MDLIIANGGTVRCVSSETLFFQLNSDRMQRSNAPRPVIPQKRLASEEACSNRFRSARQQLSSRAQISTQVSTFGSRPRTRAPNEVNETTLHINRNKVNNEVKEDTHRQVQGKTLSRRNIPNSTISSKINSNPSRQNRSLQSKGTSRNATSGSMAKRSIINNPKLMADLVNTPLKSKSTTVAIKNAPSTSKNPATHLPAGEAESESSLSVKPLRVFHQGNYLSHEKLIANYQVLKKKVFYFFGVDLDVTSLLQKRLRQLGLVT
jgi:hypothetical protein